MEPETRLHSDIKPVWLMSSGGKDSIAALVRLQRSSDYEVAGLITTFNQSNHRIALHGTPLHMLELQADLLGLPLHSIGLPPDCDNVTYEQLLAAGLSPIRSEAGNRIAFGDLFLEDIRSYRERQCQAIDWHPVFPLWGQNTLTFSRGLMEQGVKAVICCIDLERLDVSFLGREWNPALLEDLPEGVDPAGENGEFHTFVFDAPIMQSDIAWRAGSKNAISHHRYCMLDLQLKLA